MDDAELSVSNSNKNEVLSQSYSQGLERINCKNATVDYQLPAGLIRMREDQWEEFFKRYDKELEEDLEIDLHTDYDEEEENRKAEENSVEESDFKLRQLDSDVEESEDSDDEDDDEEEEEEDEEQYFEKNRAPLRKTPNLIQYWIDTGRPPILMTEEPEEFRELLGEDNPEPAVGKIKTVNSMEAEAKRPSNSVFSSVDTAAYILSNTNVTAKAETIAIVEGAKSLDLNDINVNVNSEVPDLVNGIACDKNSSPLKNSSPKKHHSPNKNIKALRINKPSPVKEIRLIETPKNLDVNNSNNINDNNQNSNTIFKDKDTNNLKPRLNNNPIAQCSPKIADVLPTHDDPTKAKVIESSNISKEYDNENSLKSLKINWNNNNNNKIDFTVNNGRKTSRKKLYTQRNSPVTIVPTTPISVHSNFNDSDYFESSNKINYETESNKMFGKLHPIFATPFNKKSKVKKIKRASWARRMSRYSKVNKSSEAEETIATPGPDNSVENNSQEEDKLNSGKKEEEDKSAKKKKKKKLIKAKKIRQSVRPTELINYGEVFSEEEKLDKSKEKILEGTEGMEKEAKETLEEVKSKELNEKKNNEAFDLLKVCKKLTINLEPLPDNYLQNRSKNVKNEIQNLEDSLESDGSTILMYECALNGKDVNTDTETGTEVSQHESEDDKSQKSGIESVKKSKKFVQRCLGSLSDKSLTEPSLVGAGNSISTRINDTDDEDDDLELGKVIQSSDVKTTDKNLKERLISFSSDEEDDFLKILSKNKSQARMSVSKLDGSKNYDSLVSDLAGESRVRLSSLVATPMAVLKIVSDSEDEQLISQDDLNVKKLGGIKKEKSPKVRSKRLELLEKKKGRFSFAGDKIKENKGLDSSKGKKLEEINCKLKLKEVQSTGTDLQSNFKTPVVKIIKSNVNSSSNKKRVSFSATKLEKILVYDSDSSDDSFFISNKSPNRNFDKIANYNNNNNSSIENGKISSNKKITFSSSGCSLANIKVFSSRFVSDSDDSND
ncbi:general transcriptional corepressor trfA-like isoform X2 [Cotesia glomerata]|uniref:general transcriptional corepressor trfA-like isoform X2 n=1 Tax=Cotesia glomerata TaxID=32391 RepID=UPI001D01E2ED|nr:general transcriptional corepressor trfA-like isoform X2 [Cotesia glomerata]